MRSFTSLLVAVTATASVASAACSCGFRDPVTNELWTDAVITYFNESSAMDSVILNPLQSADRYGQDDAGNSGDGQQPWVASQRTNEWEDDFGATWRSAVSYDNVFSSEDSNTKGLSMRVAAADQKNRISYGSQLVSRRRDILYGTFRAAILPSIPATGGTAFDMEVAYNESSLLRTGIFNKENESSATLEYSFAARFQDANPMVFNLSELDARPTFIFRQYRMDWTPASLSFSNDGTNLTSSSYTVQKTDSVNVPVVGAPFSFKHWANGSPTESLGPPLDHDAIANVLWVRLFFNSSLPARQQSFDAACSGTGNTDVCDTEDATLRLVTPFDTAATVHIKPLQDGWAPPLYATIVVASSGGLFIIILAHALVKRYLKSQRTKKEFYAKNTNLRQMQLSPRGSMFPASVSEQTLTDWESTTALRKDIYNEDALGAWDNPALALGYEDESDSDDDDDSEATFSKYEFDDPLGQKELSSSPPSMLGVDTDSLAYVPPSFKMSVRSPVASAFSQLATDRETGEKVGLALSPTTNARHSYLTVNPEDFDGSNAHFYALSNDGHAVIRPALRVDSPLSKPMSPGLDRVQSPSYDGFGVFPSAAAFPAAHLEYEDGTTAPLNWETRIAEWKPASGDGKNTGVGQLAQPPKEVIEQQEAAVVAQATKASLKKRLRDKLFVGPGKARTTGSGAARVDYLDGLRGFACLLVAIHHFLLINYFGETTIGSPRHYEWEVTLNHVLGPIISNGGLNVGIFFMLAARVIANRYLVRGNLQDLAQQIHTRVPRLGVTVTGAILINYFLIQVDAFHWIRRLASRSFSTWSYYQDFTSAGAGEFLNDWLSLWFLQPPDITPLTRHYATGILWTMPVIVQNSWSVYVCALVAREIKNPKKRYPFYMVCIVLSWWAQRYEYFFLAGLMLADLDNRLKYRELSEKGIRVFGKIRITGGLFAWAVFFLGGTLTYLGNNYNAKLDSFHREFSIHPNFETGTSLAENPQPFYYYIPSVIDFIWVISFFLLCDLSPVVRTFFQLEFWNVFGRNAFSLYLLHGVVFWSAGAALTIRLLAAGVPYWAAQIINFFVCFILLFFLCEAFTRTFDRWGITLSRAFWRATSGGLGRRV